MDPCMMLVILAFIWVPLVAVDWWDHRESRR